MAKQFDWAGEFVQEVLGPLSRLLVNARRKMSRSIFTVIRGGAVGGARASPLVLTRYHRHSLPPRTVQLRR